MISFITSILILIIGYFTYGKLVEKIFGIHKDAITPAIKINDGVDFSPLPLWKVFMIQFLNIAGLGPIFGAIAGAMFGPSAFLWIVLGSIFAGGVHDYLSGMLSLRHNGLSISEVVGIYLGNTVKQFMRVFTIILLIFVGTVFIMGPAKIIVSLTQYGSIWLWVGIILIYYIISTILPIDKLIGKLYPVFGIAMLLMALGLLFALFLGDYTIPEITINNLTNMSLNPDKTPVFPTLFVTIACGAISGFHATQSPLMARCMKSEKSGRKVFYGTMITEGIVALIWAAAAMVIFDNVEGLNKIMADNNNNAAWAANKISLKMLGGIGGTLAILGIVAAPITSGDTAFRSARLILADIFTSNQKKIKNRLFLSLPLFIIGFLLTQINFGIIWRYFAWTNQTLATIVLWSVTVYLANQKKQYWISLIPALFMSTVCIQYILISPEGLQLNYNIALCISIIATLIICIMFYKLIRKNI